MEKYHALIKNWKHIILNDEYAKVQFIIFNRGLSSEYLGLEEIDLYEPLTKDEWLDFNVYEDTATFLTDKEMESLFECLKEY